MSTPISLNALLTLPEDFDQELIVNNTYTISKSGYRITPLKMPMELSTHGHKYLGKVVVLNLNISEEKTDITFKVLKLFNDNESKIFSKNFLKY